MRLLIKGDDANAIVAGGRRAASGLGGLAHRPRRSPWSAGDRVGRLGLVLDHGHAVELAGLEFLEEAGQVEVAGADDDVVPLAVAVEGEILEVDAVDVAGVALGPFERLAQPRPDLQAPRRVDADADLRCADFDQVIRARRAGRRIDSRRGSGCRRGCRTRRRASASFSTALGNESTLKCTEMCFAPASAAHSKKSRSLGSPVKVSTPKETIDTPASA